MIKKISALIMLSVLSACYIRVWTNKAYPDVCAPAQHRFAVKGQPFTVHYKLYHIPTHGYDTYTPEQSRIPLKPHPKGVGYSPREFYLTFNITEDAHKKGTPFTPVYYDVRQAVLTADVNGRPEEIAAAPALYFAEDLDYMHNRKPFSVRGVVDIQDASINQSPGAPGMKGRTRAQVKPGYNPVSVVFPISDYGLKLDTASEGWLIRLGSVEILGERITLPHARLCVMPPRKSWRIVPPQ